MATDLLASLSRAPAEAPRDTSRPLVFLPATGLVPSNPETDLAFFLDTAAGHRPKPWFGPMFGSWWAFLLALVGVVAIARVLFKLLT